MQVQRKTLTQLSIPICFEKLFYMLSGMVDTLMPVSYTHLDVYKRQNQSLPVIPPAVKAILSTAFTVITPHSLASANAPAKPSTNDTAVPVSYTHLF